MDCAYSRRRNGRSEEIAFTGCTNYLDRIDAALLRPGRYEKGVEITRPDLAGTVNIVSHYLPQIESGERAELGRLREGSTGAELMIVARSRRIARPEDRPLRAKDVRAIVLRVEAIPPTRLGRIWGHEAGRAVGIRVLPCITLHGSLVEMRDGAAGRTTSIQGDANLSTERDFESPTVAALWGLAASKRMIASLHASDLRRQLPFTAHQRRALKAVSHHKTLRRRVADDLVRSEDKRPRGSSSRIGGDHCGRRRARRKRGS